MVATGRATQPEWSSPLVTTTGLLEQRFRFDTSFQHAGNGADTVDLDGGKGLDLIVGATTEIQIAAAPYYIRTTPNGRNDVYGFNDWPFLRIKERLLSSPAVGDDYVVSAWLQAQAASGVTALSTNAFTLLPTLGFGKGFGPFVVQGTVGSALPFEHERVLGDQLLYNLALQYHVGGILWPQIEFNATHWFSGQRNGKTQLYCTPGIVLGRFPLNDHLKFTFGVGYQVALSPTYQAKPLLPSYDHAWIVTTRLNF